jgi:hypothetical protein
MPLYWFAVGMARELADTVLADRGTAVEVHDADDGWVMGIAYVAGRLLAASARAVNLELRPSRTVSAAQTCSFTKPPCRIGASDS